MIADRGELSNIYSAAGEKQAKKLTHYNNPGGGVLPLRQQLFTRLPCRK